MSTAGALIFGVACVFYILAWKYIRQLLREVNAKMLEKRVSLLRWHKGWKTHKQLFPESSVRLRVAACIGLTVALGLCAFCIEVRNRYLLIHR